MNLHSIMKTVSDHVPRMESVWFSLPEDAFCALRDAADYREQLQLFRTRCCKFDDGDSQRAAIVLEFMYQTVHFCIKDCQMTYFQAQKYMSIVVDIFEKYCLTESATEQTKEDALKEFGEKLQGIIYDHEVISGDENAETREERKNIVFSIDITRKMASYFSFSFIRYYDAYKFCFTTFPNFKDVNIVKNVELR